MDLSRISPFAALGRFARRYRAARAEIRTRRLIETLSVSMRKDIGWPDAGPANARTDADGGWRL